MYELGLGFVPASFYVMAVLGGGIATATKRMLGLDLRGRSFEVAVIVATLWLVAISWGLVGAFFGEPSKCYGVFGSTRISSLQDTFVLQWLSRIVFQPGQRYYLMWDSLAMKSGTYLRKALCTPQEGEGCFEHLHKANADFVLMEEGGAKCASDVHLVCSLVLTALLAAGGTHLSKQRERQRRAERRRPNPQGHLHQD